MLEKKNAILKSPNLSKLREVIIDHRTKIYIALDANVEEAKNKYIYRVTTKRTK